ncbi:HlyD family efflux transporter periplasmic adaptor subunit [Catenuloplanes japonicus]|uniref:HlyD family efflux transporter periplasmic adaptor subunit n=1 Tax=Catenuloplanes japonicus TaxID=33876 RepID=UPI000524E09B|nr:HlyD family efflux transporter periplasmic adaptor subunit [Catenuloplanes japonicus]
MKFLRWAVALCLVGGGGAAAVWWAGAPDDETAAADAPPAGTVAVARTDLTTARTQPGTLGYGTPRQVKGGAGAVTWLPAVGGVAERGRTLYRVDDTPVIVLYGGTPLFRTLGTANQVGRDVRVVIDNLRAMNYAVGLQPAVGRAVTEPGTTAPVPVQRDDGVLTPAVLDAIKRWQADSGLPPTGTIDPAHILVLPGPARVSELAAQLGDPAADGVLTLTGDEKVITVPVNVTDLGTIKEGAAAEVELPGGARTPGTVRTISRDATAPDGATATTAAQVVVTVAVNDRKAVQDLESGPVQVSFAGQTREDVLAVPVAALLALREGGYAVQVAGGPLIAVRTGMFAMGMVEISGDGLAEGVSVVTVS